MIETAAVAGAVALVVALVVNGGLEVYKWRKATAWRRRNFGRRGPG